MRTRILHEGAGFLEYEIRQILDVAEKLESLGVEMTWENIGDPVAMGEIVEPWIVDIVRGLLDDNRAWGYCPTRGVLETRQFIAAETNKRGGAQITPEDILFFNGVADAVDKVYELVHRNARILLPTPIYTTHSSNESKRGGYDHLSFRLDPKNGWLPDLEEIRLKVRYNPSIAGIGLVNPDNPTGMVYPREVLLEIAEIARQHKLFLICDEIYTHICYNGHSTNHLSTIVGDVPAIVMRGVSKEYPWPGARCGWIEILNAREDEEFSAYAKSLLDSKRLEVCATTLPQMSVPHVFGDARYPEHLRKRAAGFEKRANEGYEVFKDIDGVIVNRTCGAFYMTILFEDGALNDAQTLQIDNRPAREFVEGMVKGVPDDKRFVYYLMGSEGICVTPLSGFACDLPGFRITLLETDDTKRCDTQRRLAAAIADYLRS